MDYFPAFLNLQGRSCLIVGGGDIALRKARLLTSAGAQLTLVAPEVCKPMAALVDECGIDVVNRRFEDGDVIGHWLVISATGIAAVERAVFAAADDAGIFCNGVDNIENCSYITPAIVDRSPIVIAISSGGAAPVLARKIRARIEQMLPSGLGRLASLAKQWREKVAERTDSILARRRFWESVFDGPASSDAISGNIVEAERKMADLLDAAATPQAGEAWLVGAGPGDPDLLTLRALQVMQTADVILHDRLVSADILALARRDADLVSVGKTPGCRANSQQEINALLVSLVAAGKRVCRLKGGDPLIFGRGGEEAEALAEHGFDCQIIPGITSAAGCAAYSGIPLTHRGLSQSVALVTAHGQDSIDKLDWPSLARDKQTLAFYMAVHRFPDLMNNLVSNGRSTDTPIAIIEKGTTPQQRVIRGSLGQLTLLADAHKIEPPAMLIVGEVAALGQHVVQHTDVEYAKQSVSYAKQGQ